jgi:HD-GYP domain-containing protein (c-di-GMP phosphodiesterase class II)
MADLSYKPIVVECIIPEAFPPVALHMKGSGGNYILYKTHERPFTTADQLRLARGGTQYLFVNTEDFRDVTSYLEDNLGDFLDNKEITEQKKCVILSQISTEYVAEIFGDTDDVAAKLSRCRNLVKNLVKFITKTGNLVEFMREVASARLYILSHSVKVAALSMVAHEKLFTVDRDELLDIGVGGMFHDIGMTFLSSEILEKPEALSNVEYNMVKKHPLLGHDFVEKNGLASEVSLTVIKHHHEHWDGGGYPSKLTGNNIPRSAQVAAICDIYCALTSDRPHRKASSHDEAMRIMQSEAGRTFNAELFDRFRSVVGK